MFRSLLLTALLLASGDALSAPRMSIGGGGALSYTCTKESGQTPTCTCSGYFDCKDMIDDRVCRRGISQCGTDRTTGTETCSCQWRTSIMPKNGGVMSPDVKMQSR